MPSTSPRRAIEKLPTRNPSNTAKVIVAAGEPWLPLDDQAHTVMSPPIALIRPIAAATRSSPIAVDSPKPPTAAATMTARAMPVVMTTSSTVSGRSRSCSAAAGAAGSAGLPKPW